MEQKEIDKLNKKSKVQLTLEETELAQDAFQNVIKALYDSKLFERLKLESEEDGEPLNELKYTHNRITVRLSEMFADAVETNY